MVKIRKDGQPDGRMNNKIKVTGADGAGMETRFQKGSSPSNITLQKLLAKHGFTKDVVNQKIADILSSNRKQTNTVKLDDDTSNLELIIVSIVEAAIRNADSGRLDNLLEKIFGKTVRIDGNITLESTNTNINATANLAEEDGEMIKRAIERAIKHSNT